jgi:hypothetical protein
MRLGSALEGNLTEVLARERGDLADRLRAGVTEASTALKQELRGQVTGAGMGERLARTWQDKIYPARHKQTLGPAALVYSKAPEIVRAFDEGMTIRSRDGFFLAVPTEAAGRGSGGKRRTPGEWERRHGQRLRLVYRQGAPSLLVADNARLDGRGIARANVTRARAGAYTRLKGRTTVPIFILLPQVTLPKVLDVARAEKRALDSLYRTVAQAVNSGGETD